MAMDGVAPPSGGCLGCDRRIRRLELPAHTAGELLRVQGGETSYDSDFIAQYLLALLYPSYMTRDLQLLLGTGVVALNAAVYWWLWQRRCHSRTGQDSVVRGN